MKKRIKNIAIVLLIAIAVVGNTVIIFEKDNSNDISINVVENSASAQIEDDTQGEVYFQSEYCLFCYPIGGAARIQMGCSVSWFSTCNWWATCTYGYC